MLERGGNEGNGDGDAGAFIFRQKRLSALTSVKFCEKVW